MRRPARKKTLKRKRPPATKKKATKKSRVKGDPIGANRIESRDLFVKAVLYGKSGTGKTTFAGTFPTPLLLIDVRDEGTNSISDVKDAYYTELRDFDHLEQIYWHLKKGDHDYKTVVIDTVSQLQQMMIESKVKDISKAGHWGSMTKQAWGDVSSKLKYWLTAFRDLPMHVVFIAQDRTFNIDEDEDVEGVLTPEVGPNLMPSVAKHMNADAQVICNTFIKQTIKRIRATTGKNKGKIKETKKTEFGLRVGPNPVYITKVRKPRTTDIPEVLIDPTFDKLVAATKGESNGTS